MAIKEEISGVKTSLTEKIDGVETSLTEKIDGVETSLTGKIDAIKQDVKEVKEITSKNGVTIDLIGDNIKLLSEGQTTILNMMERGNEELKKEIKEDINIIKHVVRGHSRELKHV